jgi:hypothetical protein
MRHKLAKDPHCVLLDFKVLVLHAVEQHENVFISVDERVKLGI